MNIHHLELFYYVAKHGGISAAVRHMPYGIQQPAVSSQILLLEEDLGVKLFERQPFKLTAPGTELYEFVRPFFENIPAVAAKLRLGTAPQIRFGAPETILLHHFPAVMQRVRQSHPELRLSVRSGLQLQLEAWVRDRAIDLAVLPMMRKPPPPLRSLRLLQIPLVLLVPKKSKLRDAAALWAGGKPREPLICIPETDTISQLFQAGLKKRGVSWPVAIEASSLQLVKKYVANGEGMGLSIAEPELVEHPNVRVLPLADFDKLELAAVWQGEPPPVLQAVLDQIQRYVAEVQTARVAARPPAVEATGGAG